MPLSARRLMRSSLAWFLSGLLALQPLTVEAAKAADRGIVADPNAGINSPQVDRAANGVPLVDIVRPDAHGLSHNKYSDFNVGRRDAILNNSDAALSRSVLGGLVVGNPNFREANPASVILNEVTSTRRSALRGALEVHGAAANVIVANPKGITCDSCGFVNTPRVDLTTGRPEFGPDGSLSDFKVEGGDVRFGQNGADLSGVELFDILSRRVTVGGPLKGAKELRLIAGRNRVGYRSGLITPLKTDGKTPAYAIDSTLTGGMYAGRIQIIATDKGAGVRAPPDMAANAGQMALTADGELVLRRADAKRAIRVTSKHSNIVVGGHLRSDKTVALSGLGTVRLADDAVVAGAGHVSVTAGSMQLGRNALIGAGLDNSGKLLAVHPADLTIDAGAQVDAGLGQLVASGNLAIETPTLSMRKRAGESPDSLAAMGTLAVAAGRITGDGRAEAAGAVTLAGDGSGLQLGGGSFAAGQDLTVEAASLTSAAKLEAAGRLTIGAMAGDLVVSGDATGSRIDLSSAGAMSNFGTIGTAGDLTVILAGGLANSGQLASSAALSLSLGGGLGNSGTIASRTAATLRLDGGLANSGRLESEGALTIAGVSGPQAGKLTNAAGGAIKAGSLALEVNGFDNAGTIGTPGVLRITSGSAAHNSGQVTANGDLTLGLTGLDNFGRLASNGRLTIAGAANAVTGSAGQLVNGRSGVVSGASISAAVARLDNSGAVTTPGDLSLMTGGAITNSGGLIGASALTLAGLSGGTTIAGALTNRASGAIKGGVVTVEVSALANAGVIGGPGAVTLLATDAAANSGKLLAVGDLTLRLGSGLSNSGSVVSEGHLDLGGLTWGPLTGAASSAAAAGTASAATTAGKLTNDGTIKAESIDARLGDIGNAGLIGSTGALNLSSQAGLANSGQLLAKGTLSLDLRDVLANTGTITGEQTVTIAGLGGGDRLHNLVNDRGAQITGGSLAIGGDGLANSGRIGATGDIAIATTKALENDGRIEAGHDLVLAGGTDLTNAGVLASNGRLTISGLSGAILTGTLTNTADAAIKSRDVVIGAGAVSNSGLLSAAGGSLELQLSGGIANHAAGRIAATGNAGLQLDGDLLNDGGTIEAGGQLSIGGRSGGFGGVVANENDGLLRGDSVDLAMLGLKNAGRFGSGNGALSATIATDITNSGLLYGASDARFLLGGRFVNGERSDVLAEGDLTIAGLAGNVPGSRATLVKNEAGGTVEAFNGDLTIRADAVENEQPAPVITKVTQATIHREPMLDPEFACDPGDLCFFPRPMVWTPSIPGFPSRVPANDTSQDVTFTTTTEEVKPASDRPAHLLSGGDMTIDAGRMVNAYSQIAAGGDLTVTGGSLENTGHDLVRADTTNIVTHKDERYCTVKVIICLHYGHRRWDTTDTSTTSRTIGAVYGTIEAGGRLTAQLSGRLDNDAVRDEAGQLGLFSGTPQGWQTVGEAASAGTAGVAVAADAGPIGTQAAINAEVAGPQVGVGKTVDLSAATGSVAPSRSMIDASIDSLADRPALTLVNRSPNAPYLIETRRDFIDPGRFLGSDYFLKSIHFDPGHTLERVGDAFIESRLIRDQLLALTGLRFLDGTDVQAQLKKLYDHAVDMARALHLSPGVALTSSQMAALTEDIVWPETHLVDGQDVLVPVVYLAEAGHRSAEASARIVARDTGVRAGSLNNTGRIDASVDLDISAGDAVTNIGGALVAGHDLDLAAGGLLSNVSGTVAGGNNVSIDVDALLNARGRTRDSHPQGYTDRAQALAGIAAGGDLSIRAGADIVSEGGSIAAGRSADIEAGGNIDLGAVGYAGSRTVTFEGGHDDAFSLVNQLGSVAAGGELKIGAGGDLIASGTDITAGGSAELVAAGSLEVAPVADVAQEDFRFKADSGGGLFKSKIDVSEELLRTALGGGSVSAGGRLALQAATGDLTLDGAALKSGGRTQLVVPDGDLTFKAEVQQDYARRHEHTEDFFWWTDSDAGHNHQTVRNVTITPGGGLKVTVGGQVLADYRKAGSLEASVEELSASPGLFWMKTLRDDPQLQGKVDWTGLDAAFKDWDYEKQGLTEAGAVLVAVVTTALTAGAGGLTASLAGTITNGLGVAGGSLETHLVDGAIRASVETAIEGGSFGKNFGEAMRMAGADTLADTLAGAIGDYALANGIAPGDIRKVVLHAAAGCAAGAATTGDCAAGAIAEGLQELAGKPIEALAGDSRQGTAVVGLVAAIGAALTGASADDISEAANIAETAHRFNYLAHDDLERLKTAKAACARGEAAGCAEAGRLEDKDRQQQQAYLACRADGYAGAGCLAVLGNVAAALSSYSGIAPVYLGTAEWQRIVGDKDTLDQLVRIMVPEGIDKLSAGERRELDFSIRVLTGDPTGITALPAIIKAAKDGSPTAILQAVAIFTRIKGLGSLGRLLGKDEAPAAKGGQASTAAVAENAPNRVLSRSEFDQRFRGRFRDQAQANEAYSQYRLAAESKSELVLGHLQDTAAGAELGMTRLNSRP